jgi:hypothetical protein
VPGQADVEDQQVELGVTGDRGAAQAVVAHTGAVAGRAQALLQEARQPRFVFGDQDPAHASRDYVPLMSGLSCRVDA